MFMVSFVEVSSTKCGPNCIQELYLHNSRSRVEVDLCSSVSGQVYVCLPSVTEL